MVTVYVYGLDLISQIRGEEQDFYHVDGLGSTQALTDETGNVTDTYDYEVFGELVDSSGESENDYLFAGEQFDGGLGQYYLRQRYYEQGVGRFTRRDSYEGILHEPSSLHKYVYVDANPVNDIDPSGNLRVQLLTAIVVSTILLEAYDIFFSFFDPTMGIGVELPLPIIGSIPNGLDKLGSILKNVIARPAQIPEILFARQVRIEVIGSIAGRPGFGAAARRFRKGGGNISFAEVAVKGVPYNNLKGFSGTVDEIIEGFAPFVPASQRQLPSGFLSFNRAVDAESKILEQIFRDTTAGSVGNIRLFTEIPVCEGCLETLEIFARQRPHITIEVVEGFSGR